MVRPEVTRKVRFYIIHLQRNKYKGDPTKKAKRYEDLSSDEILKVFNCIASLPKVVSLPPNVVITEEDISMVNRYIWNTRYLAMAEYTATKTVKRNGEQVTVEAPRRFLYMEFDNGDVIKDYPIKGKLMLIKADALPIIVTGDGRQKPIDIDEKDLGVSDVTHFMIFKDKTLIFEVNPNGAGTGLFRRYLEEKCIQVKCCPDVDRVILEPIPNEEKIAKLLEMGDNEEVTALELGFNMKYLNSLPEKQRSTIGGLLSWILGGNYDNYLMGRVYITLSSTPKHRYKLGFIKRLYRELGISSRRKQKSNNPIKKFKVELPDGHEYNLLEEFIEEEVKVIQLDESHRTIKSDSMFEKMEEVYKEFIENQNKKQKRL
ncbi:MAG: hypothetical protein H0Z18_08120 [Thermococcus sp.]|uniref:hypothetical protein n=1 Tax=Thermococcus sp. TaxID=35749 RepID=UPI001D304009|nr:hypothetical protein [Thermococcus sp.]MBO8175209.1 hypothetical protein [Thermococcus sp.]